MTIKLHQIKHYLVHFLRAKRNGHGIHSPFAYRLCEEVFYHPGDYYDFKTLAVLRKQLQNDETLLEVQDHGAGSQTFKGSTRKVKELAERGISTQAQSELMYRLMNFLNVRTAVELGTSLGLNTLYMAKVSREAQIVSIEGSEALHHFAVRLAQQQKVKNIHFVHGLFEEKLPGVLSALPTLDLLYVDGNHRYEATIDYFLKALPKKHNNSVFIFDDIYWSPGMTRAWEEIKKHPEVTLSIDTFYFGLVFFKTEFKEKVDLRCFI